jgi:hypothetical protein
MMMDALQGLEMDHARDNSVGVMPHSSASATT